MSLPSEEEYKIIKRKMLLSNLLGIEVTPEKLCEAERGALLLFNHICNDKTFKRNIKKNDYKDIKYIEVQGRREI